MGLRDKLRTRLSKGALVEKDDVAEPDDIPLNLEGMENQGTDVAEPDKIPLNLEGMEDQGTDESDLGRQLGQTDTDEETMGEEIRSTTGAFEDGADSAESEGDEADADLFGSIFGQQAEADLSPIDLLVASLPDMSLEEVLEEAEELKALMRGWYGS